MSWPLVKLGDVATLINGRAYKKTELLDSGSTPVLRVGNFFSNRSWYYSDLTLPEDKYCNEGDLLFAWSASFGPKIWHGPKAIYHYHIWKIVVSPAIDKNYLYHLLDSISAEIKSQGNGIAMIHATKGGMEQREIPLPPLHEQQKIAAILDAAVQLRQKDQQLIEHYTRLGQALFLEMFGDPVGNPMGWEKNLLAQYAHKITKGGSPKWQGFEYTQTGVRFITSENVLTNDISLEKEKFVPVDFDKKLKNSRLEAGDVLINIVGASAGRAAKVSKEHLPANINQAVAKIASLPSAINQDFLVRLLNEPHFNKVLLGDAVESARLNLSLGGLKKLKIIYPPIELQNQFAQHIEAIEQQKQSAQASLEKSESLFNSLLQRAFKGELTG